MAAADRFRVSAFAMHNFRGAHRTTTRLELLADSFLSRKNWGRKRLHSERCNLIAAGKILRTTRANVPGWYDAQTTSHKVYSYIQYLIVFLYVMTEYSVSNKLLSQIANFKKSLQLFIPLIKHN